MKWLSGRRRDREQRRQATAEVLIQKYALESARNVKSPSVEVTAVGKALVAGLKAQTDRLDAYHSKRVKNSRKYREALQAFRALSPEDQRSIWLATRKPRPRQGNPA